MKPKKLIHIYLLSLTALFGISCSSNNSSETDLGAVSENVETDTIISGELDFKNIRICTELLPPPPPNLNIDFKIDTSVLFREDFGNDTIFTTIFSEMAIPQAKSKAYATHITALRWPVNRRDLKVMFLDGDIVTQNNVMETAKKWEQFCGIRFLFGNHADPDITISFRYEGSWSYIGTYSKKMRPSMNFGWLNSDSSQEEYDRVVLHEFGHALGYVHEHQNPNENIKWDKEKVYNYYWRTNKWDVPTVDQNIFQKYSKNHVNATNFDPKSIMLYSIPSELTTDGFSTPQNSQLSDTDKIHVASIYPRR